MWRCLRDAMLAVLTQYELVTHDDSINRAGLESHDDNVGDLFCERRCRMMVWFYRLAEAENAITGGRLAHKHRSMLDKIVTEFGDLASFALRLLATVYW